MGFWDYLRSNVPFLGGSPNIIPTGDIVNCETIPLTDPFIPLSFSKGFTRYGMRTVEHIRAAFLLCSPLSAIINQKASAFTKGKIQVWNPNTEKPVRGQFKEWQALFDQPNVMQSGDMFFAQAYCYWQQYGYCVIDPTYSKGFVDRPSSMRNIPNWAITWEYTGTGYMERPLRAWFNWNGRREELIVKDLIIICDPGSVDIDEYTGLPLSRFASSEQEISNIVAALQVRGEMQTDRGANGLISSAPSKDSIGPVPMDQAEKDRMQKAYKRYGNMRNQDKVIVTDQPYTYTPMTFNMAQLGAHEEGIAGIKALCNTAGFPFTALAEGFEGKYNNSTNARRDFQDQTVDPEANNFFEQLSKALGMDKQNCEAYMDYSGVASVQQSQQERGTGLQAMNTGLVIMWDNGLITKNQWLAIIGEEPVALPEFDMYNYQLTPEQRGMIIQPQNNGTGNNQGQTQTDTGGN